MRTLARATLLGVGLAEATSDAWDVDLTGEASEDAVRVADAMVRVREIAEGLSVIRGGGRWPRPEFRLEAPQLSFINLPDSGPNLQKIRLKIPACS